MQPMDRNVSRLIEVFEKDSLDQILKMARIIQDKIEIGLCKLGDVFTDPNSSSYMIYYYITYVYLFSESFGIKDFDTLERASILSMRIIDPFRQYVNESFNTFELSDITNGKEEEKLLNYLKDTSWSSELEELVGEKGVSCFEQHYLKYINQLMDTSKSYREKHIGNMEPYLDGEFEKTAIGLTGYSKLIIPILAGISGKYDQIDNLEKLMDLYLLAEMKFMNLKAWKHDYMSKRYSLLITEVLTENNLGTDASIEEILPLIYCNGYDENHLISANQYIEKALFLSSGNKSCQRALRSLQVRVNVLLYDLRTLKEEPKRIYTHYDAKRRVEKDELRAKLRESMIWLRSQSLCGFPELVHWGTFLHKYGFTADEQVLSGDVFYRSLLLNIFKDLKEYPELISEDYYKSEVDYVKNAKHKYSKRGWGHFPDSPELPPDIGTISEISRLAVDADDDEWFTDVLEVINFVLNNNQRKDGAILSWITEQKMEDFFVNAKSVHCIYIRSLLKRTYRRPIPATVMSFLSNLNQLDSKGYHEIISKGYSWLESEQKDDGSWNTLYFTGKCYNIYEFIKLSKEISSDGESLKRAVENLINNQNKNGSWGQVNGDPKETSYALLGLLTAGEFSEKTDIIKVSNAIELGISYLWHSSEGREFWHGADFAEIQIKKMSTEPADLIEYRSATLTTALAVYAIDKYLSLSCS